MPELAFTPLSPLPAGTICGTVTVDGAVRLRYARWPPLRQPVRGTIVLVQGRAEFIEKYFETVEDIRRRGFAVVTYDLRGQGGSDRLLSNPLKGHVDDFDDYVRDLDAVIQDVVLPDAPPPYYILAHSTGGAIALLFASRGRTQIDRLILTSPLLGVAGRRRQPTETITSFLRYVGLGELYATLGRKRPVQLEPFARNVVTSDKRRHERNVGIVAANPQLGLGPPTISWVNAALRAVGQFESFGFAGRVPIPVLILMAGADKVVSNFAIERFCDRVKAAAYVRVPGAAHEIMMERDIYRDQFWAAFDAFLPGRLPEDDRTEPLGV